jgi:uncharacterized protein YeaO (DUF488 family)
MKIYTSTVYGYGGPDKLDITVKSGDPVFAPTWEMVMGYKSGKVSESEYTQAYTSLMRLSWQRHRDRWLEVLAMEEVTLVCYCKPGDFCHRRLLAIFLAAVAEYFNMPVEVCGEK